MSFAKLIRRVEGSAVRFSRPHPLARSSKVGFFVLIGASRLARVQDLICFSRAIALHVMKDFVIHEPINVVFLCTTIDFATFVLQGSPMNTVCDSRVERQ